MKNNQNNDYPCDGHDCYDRGNFHVSCPACPLYKHEKNGCESEVNVRTSSSQPKKL